ncbi:hypothetical protein DEU56DRAFT_905348 [Suillus clintonianus]|uniref:uncharacterized protein n=1 Tax=Suillus clintonianus TaxID=1904413 RepID=UPI001B860AAE|nr:uncharacterized protein DEU56DRAFT_905348 [Suillus clintonianus]KAG2114517.1 hypothetical protein DEU56DRAFT_905348 [Suillus clintonianus]
MLNNRLERSIHLVMMTSLAIVSIALTSTILKATSSRENPQYLLSKTRTLGWNKPSTRIRLEVRLLAFTGYDFPESLVPDVGKVRLVVEESVRFALDHPESKTEWLSTSPPGTGHVALDLTLEAGDFTTGDFEQHRIGATHVCRDWGEIYDNVAVNWKDSQLAAIRNSTARLTLFWITCFELDNLFSLVKTNFEASESNNHRSMP